jgi:hypothetical protein
MAPTRAKSRFVLRKPSNVVLNRCTRLVGAALKLFSEAHVSATPQHLRVAAPISKYLFQGARLGDHRTAGSPTRSCAAGFWLTSRNDSRLDRSEGEDQSQDASHRSREQSHQERGAKADQDHASKDHPPDERELSKQPMPRTLRRPKRGRSEPQPATRRHDQYDVTPAPQDARRRNAQFVLELLQEPERPADVPCWRVWEMTRQHAGNLGQIALFDKALPEVGWGNLPSDRATDTLPTALCPCRRSSSGMPFAACA